MMNWLYYLLEANLYLAVFYGFYRLCLHRETFYTLNRFFLILSAFISFLLPLLKVSSIYSLFSTAETGRMVVTTVKLEKANTGAALWFNLQTVIYALYFLIAALLLIRMIISLTGIFKVYYKASRYKIDNVIYVELDNQQSAFSFFNILFINANVTEKKTVLKHEMIHISQNHSADILFFELLQIISWFSPVVYMIKQDIKLIHEYIADELTTASDVHKHDYALFLIENSFGVVPAKLSNQIFNQSLIKRRIKMLNKEKSGGLAKYRLLLLAPITLGLVAASTMAFARDYAVLDLLPQKSLQQDTIKLQSQNKPSQKVKKLPPPPPVQPAGKAAKSSPPAPQIEIVRFPPPKVTKKRLVPPPPPVEPADKAAKASPPEPKIEVIRFPPPKVTKKRLPPPPPVEPAQKKSGTDEKLQSVIIHRNPTPVQTAPATLKQLSIKLKEPEGTAAKQKTVEGDPVVLTDVKIIKANP
jgi:beta-lactamase regulating signal transducer with metallopeptidase domain